MLTQRDHEPALMAANLRRAERVRGGESTAEFRPQGVVQHASGVPDDRFLNGLCIAVPYLSQRLAAEARAYRRRFHRIIARVEFRQAVTISSAIGDEGGQLSDQTGRSGRAILRSGVFLRVFEQIQRYRIAALKQLVSALNFTTQAQRAPDTRRFSRTRQSRAR